MKKLSTATISFIAAVALLISAGMVSTAQALTISPAKIEISGDPGQTISGQFVLINEQEDTKTFYSSFENFEAQGETGTPNFTTGATEGLATWIHAESSVTLKKGQQVSVPFTVSIPKDADPGGHFAAIFLSTVPPNGEGGQVSVGAKVGVLVLLRVSGAVKEGGGILSFSTKDSSRFFTTLPIGFAYRFNNSGNDRVKPDGTLRITDTIGLETISIPANKNQGNILPGSTRRFDVVWGNADDADMVSKSGFFGKAGYQWNHFAFGFYTAHLDLQYGTDKTSSDSFTTFVLPWQLLIIEIIVLAIIIVGLRFGLRKYNSWIVSRAKLGQ